MSSPNINELRDAYIKGFLKSLSTWSYDHKSSTTIEGEAERFAKLEYPNIVTVPNEVEGAIGRKWRYSSNGELQSTGGRTNPFGWYSASTLRVDDLCAADLDAISQIKKNPTIQKPLD